MSTVREQLDRDRYKLIADKIMQLLDKIHDTSLSEKRWVWELLQNAKDVPNKFGRVSIKIELFPDKLEFCHNGNHFSVNNLSGLIQQVSSKDSQEKKSVKSVKRCLLQTGIPMTKRPQNWYDALSRRGRLRRCIRILAKEIVKPTDTVSQ